VSAESEIRNGSMNKEKKWKNTGKELVKLWDVNIGVSAESRIRKATTEQGTGRTLARTRDNLKDVNIGVSAESEIRREQHEHRTPVGRTLEGETHCFCEGR
jgi:hypothetical protein